MTNGEQKMLVRGLAAGMLIGVAVGLVIALVIAMKPHDGAALLSVGIGAFTAVALSLWAAFRSQVSHGDEGPKRR
jgi:hypothetical protein